MNKEAKENFNIHQELFLKKSTTKKFKQVSISSFWTEKILISIQLIQLFDLNYAANYINLPRRWRGIYSSTYLSIVAGDLSSIIYYKSISTPDFRLEFSFFWLLITIFLILVFILIKFLLSFSALRRVIFIKNYTTILDLLYLPVALGTIPTAMCQYNNCEVNSSQVTLSFFSFLIPGLFLIIYPLILFREIHQQIVVNTSEDHEELVQLKEMEYILEISHSWLSEKYYLFSSYKRTKLRIFFKPLYLLMVLSLIFVHSIFNNNYQLKMLILVAIMTGFSFYVSVFPVYRCFSSSVLQIISFWTISCNMFLGWLKVINYNSEYLEDANLVDIIWTSNLVALILIGLIICIVIVTKMHWPVTVSEVKLLERSYGFLINDLRNAEIMVLKLRSVDSYLFIQPSAIEKMQKLLNDHHEILKNENHPLQHTVLEQMEILNAFKFKVLEESLLPCPKLEKNLETVVKVVQRRWNEHLLMNKVKSRIILKILALNLFFGKRVTLPFTSGNNDYEEDDYDLKEKFKHGPEESLLTGINDTQIDVEDKYAIESSRQLKEIKFAIERKDVRKMIQLTHNYVEKNDFDLIEELRDGWDIIGRELLPMHLYDRLYNDEIEIELS